VAVLEQVTPLQEEATADEAEGHRMVQQLEQKQQIQEIVLL
jgi:hypothetical protein